MDMYTDNAKRRVSIFEDTMDMKAIVIVDAYTQVLQTNQMYMFDEANEILDEDDCPVLEITCWLGKNKLVLKSENFDIISDAGIEKGDVFNLGTDAKGYVNNVIKYFDLSTGTVIDSSGTNISNPAANKRTVFAPVYDRIEDRIKISSVLRNNTFVV